MKTKVIYKTFMSGKTLIGSKLFGLPDKNLSWKARSYPPRSGRYNAKLKINNKIGLPNMFVFGDPRAPEVVRCPSDDKFSIFVLSHKDYIFKQTTYARNRIKMLSSFF